MAASSSEINKTETIARGPVPCRTLTVSALGWSTGLLSCITFSVTAGALGKRTVQWSVPHASDTQPTGVPPSSLGAVSACRSSAMAAPTCAGTEKAGASWRT